MANFFSSIVVVFKRLWHNLGLSLSALLGIIAIMAIAVCVPVFSHSVAGKVLRLQLDEKVASTHRRLFSLHLFYQDNQTPSVFTIDNAKTVSDFLRDQMAKQMGLPVEQIVMGTQSGIQNVADLNNRGYDFPNTPVARWRFLFLDILPQSSDLVEGKWPEPDLGNSGPIQVAVPDTMADEMLLKIGDLFQTPTVQVQIVGFWRAKNNFDPLWFNNPDIEYSNTLWVPELTYRNRIAKEVNQPVFFTFWYVIVPEKSVNIGRAPQYLRGMVRLDRDLQKVIPGIKIDYSPMEALQVYQKRADTMTTLLYAVGSPMIVLALLFITLTARIAVQQYENEIATMRGRGTSRFQVLSLNLIESLVLVTLAFFPSLGVGWLAANLMVKTVSFLSFTSRSTFPFSLEGVNYLLLGTAVVLIVLSRFMPAVNISRITIIRLKQEQSRASLQPFWQRFYLDFLLLLPGIYAYVVLRGWAKPAQFIASLWETGEQYRDPLLFIAPAIMSIAICMLMLRLVPLFLRLLAAIVERLPGVWAYLSLQQVARRPEDHTSTLLLIMISLSLSIFSASTAKTLDRWLYDSAYYQAGSDLAVQELIISSGGGNTFGIPSGGTTVTDVSSIAQGFISVEEHLKLPTVQAATRVGIYGGVYSYGVGELNCVVMGIDRLDFPSAGFYRADFASQSLGSLMNALGGQPMGVLVPEELTKKSGLGAGDQLNVTINVADQKFDRELIIVGTYRYFPTVYPSGTTVSSWSTLIVNLESIFDNPEAAEGFSFWLRLKENADLNQVLKQLRGLINSENAAVKIFGNAIEEIKKGQDQPERVGLFGILNVGFLTTGLMPGIGFLLYSYASLRRRFIQLGILQAIGLSVQQLVGYLVFEQLLLMGLAVLIGAGIGLVCSYLFVPLLQVGASLGVPIPPFQVLIGWAETGWLCLGFSLVLVLTVTFTILYLVRLKVFQAVKMGETL